MGRSLRGLGRQGAAAPGDSPSERKGLPGQREGSRPPGGSGARRKEEEGPGYPGETWARFRILRVPPLGRGGSDF